MSMHHCAPPPELAQVVSGFSERCDDRAGACMEFPLADFTLQFMLGGDYLLAERGRAEMSAAPRAALWGLQASVRPAYASGAVHVFIVHLTPIGARTVARGGCRESVDRVIDLAAVWGAAGREWGEKLAEAPDFKTRVEISTVMLGSGRPAERASLMTKSLEGMARAGEITSIDQLASMSGIGARALRKQFDLHLGLSPKFLLSLFRFQRLLRALHPNPWLAAPFDLFEYADQAHAAREFKRFAGTTPGAYRAAKRASGDRLVQTLLL